MKRIGSAYTLRTDQCESIGKATRALGFKSQAAFVRYAVDGELERLGYKPKPKKILPVV